MRRSLVSVFFATACLSACHEDATKPTGPVTLKISAGVVLPSPGYSARDTIRGIAIIDGQDTVTIPGTVLNFARGDHTFDVRLATDYLNNRISAKIDPTGSTYVLDASPVGTCRLYSTDAPFCSGHNFIGVISGQRVVCPASDFADFCTSNSDPQQIGATWPDSGQNIYITHGKLLIGAQMGPEIAAASGNVMAMSFFGSGDYSPYVRHHRTTDSVRFQNEVWTDARHFPLYAAATANPLPPLADDDRPDNRFGLSVRATYTLPTSQKNALLIRWDITNISNAADYRFRHASEPVGGHSIKNVYFAPMIDPNIGGTANSEGADDNATMFPQESLMVAYDQKFSVPGFASSYRLQPGMVGLQLISGPAGTVAKGIVIDANDSVRYGLKALEDTSYRIISAGRYGAKPSCTSTAQALVCSPETESNVRMGWSIGPIASFAPGQTTTIIVAVLFATPQSGSFTSGTAIAPQNDQIGSQTRALWAAAAPLRALAAATKSLTVVDGTPGRH